MFTLLRPFMEDRQQHGPAILEDKARSLRTEGYRRIVSSGQSYGAWISFEVAAHPGVLDAIIATSPARYGDVAPVSARNAEVIPIAAAMTPVPSMVFLFAGDDFDPGGRGPKFEAVLEKAGAAYAVIDRPDGFLGHSVALSTAFAAQFAPCILSFLAFVPPPGPFTCPPYQPTKAEILARFPKMKDEREAGATSTSSPFLGHWYGWYAGGGRESLLTVDNIFADGRMNGSYAFGPAHHDETARVYHVDGMVKDGVLHVATPHSQLDYRIRPDGRLDLHWSAAGGSGDTVMRKLE